MQNNNQGGGTDKSSRGSSSSRSGSQSSLSSSRMNQDETRGGNPGSSPTSGTGTLSQGGSGGSNSANVNTGPSSGNKNDQETRFVFRRASSKSPTNVTQDGDNVYCVKRSQFEEQIMIGFSQLFCSAEMSDVTIACEGEFIRAHKFILALSSPYFRRLFDVREIGGKHPVLLLHGIKLNDMRHVLRFVYLGQVNVRKSEIDNFIAAAECLKIDGILGEEEDSQSHDSPTPDDYYRDWPSSDTQNNDNEEPRSSHSAERIYSETNAERSYSPQDFSSTRNQRYQGEYSSPQNNGSNSQSSQGYDTSSERIFRTPSGDRIIDTTKNKRGVITSAEGRPCTIAEDPFPETVITIQAEESSADRRTEVSNTFNNNSEYEGRHFSYPTSPTETFRPPVISRKRRATSDLTDGQAFNDTETYNSSPRKFFSSASGSKSFRPSAYPTMWDTQTTYPTAAETSSFDNNSGHSSQDYQERDDRTTTSPPTQNSHHGFSTKYPFSVISRPLSESALSNIPISLLNSGGLPGFISNRNHAMSSSSFVASGLMMPTTQGASNDSATSSGVIKSHISDLSMPNPTSTLEMLRAKIASGQHIYSRGYRRHDRYQPNPPHSAPPSEALGINPQDHERDSEGHGPNNSMNLISNSSLDSHSAAARPKTKAIRSSQVPPSCRYTAVEVDGMVDQVQHFPGNMVPCAICQKFVKRERLRAHIHECHLLQGKRILCPHCGIGLKSKGSFRVHIWRHKKGALPSRLAIMPPIPDSQNPQDPEDQQDPEPDTPPEA